MKTLTSFVHLSPERYDAVNNSKTAAEIAAAVLASCLNAALSIYYKSCHKKKDCLSFKNGMVHGIKS